MAEGEAPEKVRRENDARWKEYAKMAKLERKIRKKIIEDPGQGPFIPGPTLLQTLPERPALKRCGECNQCKALD